jgi:MULE transposase domain
MKANVKYKIIDIKVMVEQMYHFKVNYMKYWRVKEIIIAQLFGGWKQAYNLIVSLLGAMQNNNPSTKVEWFTIPTNNSNYRFFQGVCWAFGPAIRAFKHCRPVIGIDATFLSGRYKGELMTACDYDAEDQLVPLSFGLFDKETNLSWERFMKFARQKVIGSRMICVISDRHVSILRVFREAYLGWHEDAREVFHRYCSRLICQNFQCHFKD